MADPQGRTFFFGSETNNLSLFSNYKYKTVKKGVDIEIRNSKRFLDF